jgi:hypothetical protein
VTFSSSIAGTYAAVASITNDPNFITNSGTYYVSVQNEGPNGFALYLVNNQGTPVAAPAGGIDLNWIAYPNS